MTRLTIFNCRFDGCAGFDRLVLEVRPVYGANHRSELNDHWRISVDIKDFRLLKVANKVITGGDFEKEQAWAEKFIQNAHVLPSPPPTVLDLKIEPQIQRALILYTIISNLIKEIGAEGFQEHIEEVKSARQSQEFCSAILVNFVCENMGISNVVESGFQIFKGWLIAPKVPVYRRQQEADFRDFFQKPWDQRRRGEEPFHCGPS